MGTSLAVAALLAAAESDQYYAWFERIPDATVALDRRISDDLQARLRDINSHAPEQLGCSEVAGRLLAPYWTTGTWFVIGATKDWGFAYRPANATERIERYAPRGLYRVYGLWPLGVLVPIDPSVRVGDVVFGTDKLGHFLNNSARYWETYEEALRAGRSTDEAVAAAIQRGVAQEAGILGSGVAGVFSYADLESNYQGLQLYRSWCEQGGLVLRDHQWVLIEAFSWARWVNPCWDESFYPSAYSGLTADGVSEALRGLCLFRNRPQVVEQRRRYRALGCHSHSVGLLDGLIAAGELPDPTPFDVDQVCGGSPGRVPDGGSLAGDDPRHKSPPPVTHGDNRRGPAGACFPRTAPRRRHRGATSRTPSRGSPRHKSAATRSTPRTTESTSSST